MLICLIIVSLVSIILLVIGLFLVIKDRFSKNNKKNDNAPLYLFLGVLFGVATVGFYKAFPKPLFYVMEVNKEFITSGKLINSENEAIEFKIIDKEMKNSYFVNKKIDKINFKFDGKELTTILKDISCENTYTQIKELMSIKNIDYVKINEKPASFVLRSNANKNYECSNNSNKDFILTVGFKN